MTRIWCVAQCLVDNEIQKTLFSEVTERIVIDIQSKPMEEPVSRGAHSLQ